MSPVILSSTVAPHPCRRCGAAVRTVQADTGGLITIDEAPVPHGDLIPWPSSSPAGIAVARRVTVPVQDGPMWQEHHCLYT